MKTYLIVLSVRSYNERGTFLLLRKKTIVILTLIQYLMRIFVSY